MCLRHCQATGNWVLIINGKLVASGAESVWVRDFDISFEFNDKALIIYANGNNGVYYEHTLVIDAVPIDDVTKKVDVKMDEQVPAAVAISKWRTYREMGNVVAVFVMEVTTGSGETISVERRYSDFAYLDASIRSSTDGHMYYSVPNLPPKVYNPFFDQASDDFLQVRETFHAPHSIASSSLHPYPYPRLVRLATSDTKVLIPLIPHRSPRISHLD